MIAYYTKTNSYSNKEIFTLYGLLFFNTADCLENCFIEQYTLTV